MKDTEYVGHDAVALAARVRAGDVRAEELLDLAIERLEALNPKLNAVVHRMDDDGRAAARRTDADPGSAGPLAGVPFLVKDLMTHHAGHPTSAGSRFLAETAVPRDSELTRRVRASGVSPFGKTNLPEWGLLPTTEPARFGPTRNPWDLERTPGGSSGGSGAAVAAGIVPLAGAGDGGGSIRIPASCCGLFGLKPTRARTPTGPDQGLFWRGATVEHVLTRSVRDSAVMLDATHGPDPGAPFEIPPPARPYVEELEADPGSLRIGWTTTPSVSTAIDDECVRAVHDALGLLEELGHRPIEVRIPMDGEDFSRCFLTVVAAELGADIEEAADLVGRRPGARDLEPSTRALALLSGAISARDFALALRGLERIGREVGVFFADYDVLLTPTLATPPPLLGTLGPSAAESTALRILGAFGSGRLVRAAGVIDQAAAGALDFTPFTPLFNTTGHPAMSVPCTGHLRDCPSACRWSRTSVAKTSSSAWPPSSSGPARGSTTCRSSPAHAPEAGPSSGSRARPRRSSKETHVAGWSTASRKRSISSPRIVVVIEFTSGWKFQSSYARSPSSSATRTAPSTSWTTPKGVTEPGTTPRYRRSRASLPKEKPLCPRERASALRSTRRCSRATTSHMAPFLSRTKRFLVWAPGRSPRWVRASSTVKTGR